MSLISWVSLWTCKLSPLLIQHLRVHHLDCSVLCVTTLVEYWPEGHAKLLCLKRQSPETCARTGT
jgi:hypothetical protein